MRALFEPTPLQRNGTDNAAMVAAPVATSANASANDYAGLTTPSVWRTGRSGAAAKVDALSNGGMDDYEIPAFLRKQAD